MKMKAILLSIILLVSPFSQAEEKEKFNLMQELSIVIQDEYNKFYNSLIKEMRHCYDYAFYDPARVEFCDNIVEEARTKIYMNEVKELKTVEDYADRIIQNDLTIIDVINDQNREQNMAFVYESIALGRVASTLRIKDHQAEFLKHNKSIELPCRDNNSVYTSIQCNSLSNSKFLMEIIDGTIRTDNQNYKIEIDVTDSINITPAVYKIVDGKIFVDYLYDDPKYTYKSVVPSHEGTAINGNWYKNMSTITFDTAPEFNDMYGLFLKVDNKVVAYLEKGTLSKFLDDYERVKMRKSRTIGSGIGFR